MIDLFAAAYQVHILLFKQDIPHVFFGGIAVQHWGEPRVTRDVDLAVLANFGFEEEVIDAILAKIPERIEEAKDFALLHRSLLCKTETGIPIDIGLAAFPFETRSMDRAVLIELTAGKPIPLVVAEDLITMKVFAGRPRDWEDVRGILVRQRGKLDWGIVETELPSLLDLIEDPERYDLLIGLRDQISG